jgi:O-antigen/teichoic acid export membrane protein
VETQNKEDEHLTHSRLGWSGVFPARKNREKMAGVRMKKQTKQKIASLFNFRGLKTLFRNSMTLLIGDSGAAVITLIAIAIMINALEAADYGIFVLIQTYALVIDRLVNFQSWQAFIKYGAEALDKNDETRLKKLIYQGTILDILTAVTGTVIAVAGVGVVYYFTGWDTELLILLGLFSLTILFNFTGIPTGILRIFDYYKAFSVQTISVALIKLIGISIGYFLGFGLFEFGVIYLVADIIGNLILVTIAYVILFKKRLIDWYKEKLEFEPEFIKFAVWTNLSDAFSVPVKYLDVYIVSLLMTYEAVGVYRLFKQIASVMNRLANPIYHAIFPEFAREVAEKRSLFAIKKCARVSLFIGMIIGPGALLLGSTSEFWLNILFDEVFASYWIYLFIFLIFTSLDTMTLPIHPLFNALGYAKQKFFITASVNILYLAIAYLLGSAYGLVGIITAWGVQFMLITSIKAAYIYYKQFYLNPRPVSESD